MQLELRAVEFRADILCVAAATAGHVYQRVGVLNAAFDVERVVLRVVVSVVRVQLAIALQHLHVTLHRGLTAFAQGCRVASDIEGRVRADAQFTRRRACGMRETRRGGRADHRLVRVRSDGNNERQGRAQQGPVAARR